MACDQFKPMRIRENLVVNYNEWKFEKTRIAVGTPAITVCKITQAKTKGSAIGTVPTQRPFEGFLLYGNCCDNIHTPHHTDNL